MNKLIIDKYLSTLYLKSKNDFRTGYNEKLIAKLIGIDRLTAKNVIYYLSSKKLVDTKTVMVITCLSRPQE